MIINLPTSPGKIPNYKVDPVDESDENTESDHQDSDDEPSEPNEASGREDELVRDGVLYERERTGDDVHPEFDEPAESNESRPAKEYETITLSSDDEECELLPQSSTMTSANLTLVYGVEYRAPDESD